MAELSTAFELDKNVLDDDDIASLRQLCRQHFADEGAIPSYLLIDHLDLPAHEKITRMLESKLSAKLHYLNDFYIYTDDTFGTGWHMDTELFTFEHAVNAWILLSPDEVSDPLCFLDGINDQPDRYYHSMKQDDDCCTFSNYRSRQTMQRSLKTLENERLHTPVIELGDVLTLNPRRFHRTNTEESKHCLVIKYVYEGENGLLSAEQVPSLFWPEVGIMNKLVKSNDDWNGVVDGLRGQLTTPEGREALSAGFYPEKIKLYADMAQTL